MAPPRSSSPKSQQQLRCSFGKKCLLSIRGIQTCSFLSSQGTREPLQRNSVLRRGWGVQLRAVSWGSGHWGLALPPLPVAQVFTESSVHGSVLCTHWTGLAGRGGKLTRVSQAQIPPRPCRPQLGVAGSGDPEAWAAPPV